MIAVKLREAMERYRLSSGERLTYAKLATRTGISRATLEAIASRPKYNTTLATVDELCKALRCSPGELLVLVESPRASKPAARRGAVKRRSR